jgi:glycosyltransferase involved in cell wall biosynthesis
MNPFFSIIIPTYNRADFITKTLDSVLNQSFQNFEVIVVDNCSTDNTLEIMNSISDTRVSYYINEQNYDRSYSRNRGIDIAKGEFITFLDSDDLYKEDCLQDAFDFIQFNPKSKFFYCDYDFIDLTGGITDGHKFSPRYDTAIQNILYGNYISCIGVFVEKNLMREEKFDTTDFLIGSEDWEIWIRIIGKVENVGHIPKVNTLVTEHPGRTMNQFNGQKLEQRTEYIISKNLHIAEKYKFKSEFISSAYILIGNGYQESNDVKNALKYWKKAISEKISFVFHYRALALLKNIIIKSII